METNASVMTRFSLVGLQAFLVGIVVPDPEVMPSWAQKRGIEGTYAELCANKVGTVGLSPKRLQTFGDAAEREDRDTIDG